MKHQSLFYRSVSLLSILMLLSLPFEVSAQPSPSEQAAADAKTDAKLYVSPFAWGAYGFACACLAIPHANLIDPNLPIDRIIGKSPEYVDTYTHVFRQHAKRRRLQAAAIGCGISAVIGALTFTVPDAPPPSPETSGGGMGFIF